MNKKDFYFELPQELIAQTPLADRSASRLMLLDKKSGSIKHSVFKNIVNYLRKGDCIVINDTKVIPARLFGKRKTGGKVELLLLSRKENDCWEALARPGKKARTGEILTFSDELSAEVIEIAQDGKRIIKFNYEGIFEEILYKLGQMPLPPYIKQKLEDKDRYQTVYAKYEGSAAAPTAGLHFTAELLEEIKNMGVNIARVTLHVGLGTFRPVKAEDITQHKMHSEYYNIEKSQADIINNAVDNGNRIIAVGTTSTRVLESSADKNGHIFPKSGYTDIFIYPGYKFKIVNNIITNFHLPESTLIMLVSALAGRENILKAYDEAIKEKYRFFSFGDAMFISDF